MLRNLVSLCPHHHRLHHQGLLGISGNADDPESLVFTDATSSPLPTSGSPTTPTGDPPTPDRRYEPPLMGRVDDKWVGNSWVHPDEQLRRRHRHN